MLQKLLKAKLVCAVFLHSTITYADDKPIIAESTISKCEALEKKAEQGNELEKDEKTIYTQCLTKRDIENMAHLLATGLFFCLICGDFLEKNLSITNENTK